MEIENNFARPVIVLSACLDGEPVRYNGEILHNDLVEKLKESAEIIKVCPEVSIGLGVPRDPIKIYLENERYRIYQSKTGIDLTEKMEKFSVGFLDGLKDVDGFLLKGQSPSCGFSGTKIYSNKNARDIVKKGTGLFAQIVKEKFPDKPIEDELRLRDSEIKKHFLTRIFAISEMKSLERKIHSINQLIEFHTRYKYLLMLYSQSKLTQLGKIVAGYKKGNLSSTVSDYSRVFYTAFERKPGVKKQVNVIQHIYGYFKTGLNQGEKRHFLNLLKKYSEGKAQYDIVLEMVRNFALRFSTQYLLFQRYLNPYPEQLND
ncbi:MAG: DUF523 and DUF1722 domain-containing protein [Candidatus Omnitrophica bacterium]|nr:DUF523 and DUF1722 domain-containing protein [Candidatus Omnitrophota bacterium]MCM8828205.1 DUF523 and DUF1722 domain-containing protein [Candidatus Omnitrophota bacterium]